MTWKTFLKKLAIASTTSAVESLLRDPANPIVKELAKPPSPRTVKVRKGKAVTQSKD